MKIPIVLLVLILSINNSTFAQRWNLAQKHSIDIVTGVEVLFLKLSQKEADLQPFARARLNSKSEMINSAYRFGIDYSFALTEKLFLSTGARYFSTGYSSNTFEIFNPTEQGDILQLREQGQFEAFNYQYKFLEIPLSTRWVYSRNRCKSFVEGGVSGMVYLQSRVTMDDDTAVFSRPFVPIKEAVTPFHLFAHLSIGGEFWITKELPAYIQLMGRVQMTEFENDGLEETVQAVGIKSGIRYLF